MNRRFLIINLFALILAMVLGISSVAAPVAVNIVDSALTEQKAILSEDVILDGDGTPESPYLISNALEYAAFCSKVNDELYLTACCTLTEDIDFGGASLEAIGTLENPYKGTFDGNGKTLTGFVLTGTEYIGIFGYTNGAVIKNLFVGTFDADLSKTVAEEVYLGTVAYAKNTTISKVCVNNETLNLTGQTKYVYIGAIAGYGESDSKGKTLIEDCYSLCDITFVNEKGYGYIGGMVGRFVTNSGGNSLVNHCYNLGNLSSTTYNSSNVGGLVGYLYSHGSPYSPEAPALSADEDIMISNSFAAASVYAKSTAYSPRVGKIAANVNSYATCDKATTLYTNDASVTATGTVKNFGTAVSLANLQTQSYISSKLGFDFVNVWKMPESSTYKYPTFKDAEITFDADTTKDFLAVSSDCSIASKGNKITIEKLRFAPGHKLTLDRGTYIIGEIEGTPTIEAHVNANVIIMDENKPEGYVELNIGDIQSGNVRYAEVNGKQYKILAEGDVYGLVVNENTLVEIVEKTSENTAAATTKYFVADPVNGAVSVQELNDYMNSTDTYGMRIFGKMGLRFKALVNAEKKKESENFKIVEYGYILSLKRHLDAQEDSHLNFDFSKYVSGYAYNEADGTDLVFSTDNGIDAFTAVLYDIPTTGYKQYVVAKTYTKVNVGGTEYTVYGEEMCSSLYDVASALKQEELTEEQMQVVDGVLNA